MSRTLLISVRFHDGRYHGTGDWPPAPSRLFQALVAGAAEGGNIPAHSRHALEWLESLGPPQICAPPARAGQGYRSYVPNNDLDAVGGNPDRISEIRAPKQIRPRLFDATIPFMYLWSFEDPCEGEAEEVVAIADRLYQLGRGVDMAWARAEILEAEETDARFSAHGGPRYRPCQGGEGVLVLCPAKGTLDSLIRRFEASRLRFHNRKSGRKMQQLFAQPPKARFVQVPYDSPPTRLMFELRRTLPSGGFQAWPLARITRLVEFVRNDAAGRLKRAYEDSGRTEEAGRVERVLGLRRDAGQADKAQRVQILPLPSIGHAYADQQIRRILVEAPADCPLSTGDIAWAVAECTPHDPETGEIAEWRLVAATDAHMATYYGVGQDLRARLWRTVTPAALPVHRRQEGKAAGPITARGGADRTAQEATAIASVRAALRHAGVDKRTTAIRVQREPFGARGAMADTFADGTRFRRDRLWHVEIEFDDPPMGPLLIGDGRYLGLGLMAPERRLPPGVAIYRFADGNAPPISARREILGAMRRALMAVERDEMGKVTTLFSGHAPNGSPAGDGSHEHVFLAADGIAGNIDRLCVARPDVVDRSVRVKATAAARFDRVTRMLKRLHAGKLGSFVLARVVSPEEGDALIGPSRDWISQTPYSPTRHAARGRVLEEALVFDVIQECERRGLPRPEIEVLELRSGPKGGNLQADLRLRFAVAVDGPILLGRDSHRGGGLFGVEDR